MPYLGQEGKMVILARMKVVSQDGIANLHREEEKQKKLSVKVLRERKSNEELFTELQASAKRI